MPSPASDTQHAALQQAAWWYATLLEVAPDSDDHARWRAWLQEPQHARAWAQVEAVSRQFEPLRAEHPRAAADAGLKAARRAGSNRRRVLSGLASVAAVGALGWQYPVLRREWQTRTADLRTATGELRDTTLADGSSIWLAPGSALDVDYSTGLRRLRLHAGQIHVATAPDPRRAFVVETAWARLQALGTRFNVKLHERGLQLAVHEGAVRVQAVGTVRIVPAGAAVEVSAAEIGPATPLAPQADAWTRGILVADPMPLQAVIAELSQYRSGHLGIDPSIARLQVVGVFPLRDTDAALALLEQSLPVRVQRPLRWWTSVEARR